YPAIFAPASKSLKRRAAAARNRGVDVSQNSADTPPPVIIVRKKGGHQPHHGGAWKVAYADFVTAMMALFIVLWLMNSSDKIKKAISAYFQDPSGRGKMAGSASAGTGETVSVGQDDMTDLKDKLEQALKKSP